MSGTSSGMRALRRAVGPAEFSFLSTPISRPKLQAGRYNEEQQLCGMIRRSLVKDNYSLGRWIYIHSQLSAACTTLPSAVAAAAAAAITMAKRRVVGFNPDALLVSGLLDRALTSAGLTCRSTMLLVYSAVNSGLPDSVLSEIITNSRARLSEDPDVVGLIELAYLIRRCSGPHYPDILQVLIERLSATEKSISWESLPSSSIAMSLVVLSDIPKTVTEQWREDCERQLSAAPVSGDVVRILARECGRGGRLPNAAVLRAVVSSQAARAEPPGVSLRLLLAAMKLSVVEETLLASLAWETSRLLADRIDQLRAMDIFALSCTLLAPPARGPVGEILALDETLLHAMGEAVAVARHRLSAVNLETILGQAEVCAGLGIDEVTLGVMGRRLMNADVMHAVSVDVGP
ncbi:hypothetical protein FOZ62_025113 [Perkinsus olseni]|uniref:Uncharacterized protein n=1 Tax=Perkinsus olseni TaxID=32597 RepID=A0A7J6S5B4_PEROL|nr:hypothetical protein FOZ62_025113 [Perkinsus olseni]